MKISIFFTTALLINNIASAMELQGDTVKAAFLGNSYTAVNNLPQIIADIANSTGDVLIFDSNTPGGYTLQAHSANGTSLSLIQQGIWNYVVLQEQSQRPSFPISQVETDVFPYAEFLDSIINQYNPCGETVFYMTWGYRDGDQQNCPVWPPVCTYEGMDSLIQLRYRMMADDNNASLSPVGKVRHYLRDNYPAIELYQADGSHPTEAASYAGACCFYSVFYHKDPTLISYDYVLSSSDAQVIKEAVKTIVYDSLTNWLAEQVVPVAGFSYTVFNDLEVTFSNSSENATEYFWDFGDGFYSTEENPVHVYSDSGTYVVTLISKRCEVSDSASLSLMLNHSQNIHENISGGSLFSVIASGSNELVISSEKFLTGKYLITICNIMGQEILQKLSVSGYRQVINIKGLPRSTYYIIIRNCIKDEPCEVLRFTFPGQMSKQG